MYNSNHVFAAASMGIFLFGIGLIALGSTLPEMLEKFKVSALDAGFVTSLMPFSILLGSIFFGPIVDRYGYKWILFFCSLFVIAGMESMAFAKSWTMIQLGVFLIGLGGGALNGTCSALVADTNESDRGAKLSLLGVFFGIGALGMPLLLNMLSPSFSAEQILSTIGLTMLFAPVYIIFLAYPKPKQAQGVSLKEGLGLLKNPLLLLLSFSLFLESGLEGLTMNWSTNYFQNELGIASKMALTGLTVHMAGMTVMRFLLGFLLKRYSAYSMLMLSLAFVLLGIGMLWMEPGFNLAIIAIALLGLGFAGVFPIILGRIGDIWSAFSGTVFSITLVISLIGNMLINYLMGILSFNYSMGAFPVLLLVCAVLYLIVIVGLRKQFQSA